MSPPPTTGAGSTTIGPWDDVLPPGLKREWPVPRQEVLGTRDGVVARLESVGARAILSALDALPPYLRARALGGLARTGKFFDRSHTRAARDFLSTAFPHESPERIEGRVLVAWRHFLEVVVNSEAFERHVSSNSILDHYELDLSPEVRDLFASDRGRIVITGHLGDWEAGSAVLPWIGCDPLYVISKPPRNRPLSVHAQRVREGRGIRLIPRRGAMQHAATIVRAGGTLAMLLDQRARTRPVFAPFFGRLARCDRSAGVLLRRLRAPAVVGACYVVGPWRWRVVMKTVIHPRDLAGQSPEQVSARVNALLEDLIRAHPEQYLWLHDRYRGADEAARAQEAATEATAVEE